MPIRAQSADGKIHEFPDGTDRAIVDKAMKAYATKAKPADAGISLSGKATGTVDDYGAGLAANFGQGVLMGAADEAYGIAPSIVAPAMRASLANSSDPRAAAALSATDYETGRDNYRNTERNFAAENPITAIGANLAGGLVSGYGATKALPGLFAPVGASTLGNIGRGVAGGAGAAAVSGFAAGEGSAGERLKGAAIAAPIGGALGGALPLATGIYRGLTNAGAKPANIMGGGTPDEIAADAYLGQQLTRDGMDPAAMRAAIDANAGSGKPLTMADLGGESTRGALDMAVNRPGAARSIARDFFRRRQTGMEGGLGASAKTGSSQADRLAQNVRDNVGDANYFDALDSLAAKRAADAKPLYDAAYEGPGYVTPNILGLLKTPSGQKALNKAREIVGDEIGAAEPGMVQPLMKELDAILSPDGSPIPMRVLDLVKRGLDNVVNDSKDITGKMDSAGTMANRVLGAFRNELKSVNPKYAEALDAWAGPTQAMSTIRDGHEAFVKATQPEQIAAAFNKLSPADQDLFRIGAARSLQEKIASVAQDTFDASKRVVTGSDVAKLRVILPPDKLKGFLTALEQEKAMYATTGTMGGSATAKRLANEVDADAFEVMLADRATGNLSLKEMALAGVRWLRERPSGVGSEKVRENITRALLSDNPAAQKAALDRIERQLAAKSAIVQSGGRFASTQGLALGSSVGNTIGGR